MSVSLQPQDLNKTATHISWIIELLGTFTIEPPPCARILQLFPRMGGKSALLTLHPSRTSNIKLYSFGGNEVPSSCIQDYAQARRLLAK
jgi:hypothetical protein